jgi:hypothetical protein
VKLRESIACLVQNRPAATDDLFVGVDQNDPVPDRLIHEQFQFSHCNCKLIDRILHLGSPLSAVRADIFPLNDNNAIVCFLSIIRLVLGKQL